MEEEFLTILEASCEFLNKKWFITVCIGIKLMNFPVQ
jgi:hypothetical protein